MSKSGKEENNDSNELQRTQKRITELEQQLINVTELQIAEMNKIKIAHFNSILNGLSSLIYIIDPKICEIIYANKPAQNLFHKSLVGGKCYIELLGFEKPCDFCTNDIIGWILK